MKGFGNLLEGYRRFRANKFATASDRWQELAEGQEPRAIVIACSDSRADPATIFDTDPGEIFVVRNVANLVPPFEPGGGRHGARARHIQIAGAPGRHEPKAGEIDFAGFCRRVDALGYRGWVGAEYMPATTTEAGLRWLLDGGA